MLRPPESANHGIERDEDSTATYSTSVGSGPRDQALAVTGFCAGRRTAAFDRYCAYRRCYAPCARIDAALARRHHHVTIPVPPSTPEPCCEMIWLNDHHILIFPAVAAVA